jgi:hypothetical protein
LHSFPSEPKNLDAVVISLPYEMTNLLQVTAGIIFDTNGRLRDGRRGTTVFPARKRLRLAITISYPRAFKRLLFVILSAAKNLSSCATEILHEAQLHSE